MHRSTRRTALAALLLGVVCLGGSQWPRRKAGAAAALPTDDLCIVAPPTPYDRTSGLPLAAARAVPADARCPVCGMLPARSLAWAAQVIFADGDAYFFDSPVSLLLYLGNPARYTQGRSASDIVARYVTDAATQAWIDADTAFYVQGSSALGPMRAGNLPALGSADAARQFAQQRGGRVLALGDIDAALLQSLAPGGHAAH